MAGTRGAEKMAILSSPPFLVCNWSGAHGAPSRRGGQGKQVHIGAAGTKGCVASGAQGETELSAIKPFLPICPFPGLPLVFSDSYGTCPRQGTPLLPELQRHTVKWVSMVTSR